MSESATSLRIEVLGPVRVYRGPAAIDLGPAKQRAVFAALALHFGQSVSIDSLLESVWGGDQPVSSRQLVHTYVARLRRILEPEMPPRARIRTIASTHGGYCLVTQPESVDITRFSFLYRQARERRLTGEPIRALNLLGEAMRMWRDPTLAELGTLLRTAETTEALRQRWCDAALDYITVGLELGEAGLVLPVAQQLAAAEPMHEVVQARYLAVLEQTGQRAAAIAHFNDLRVVLSDELGVAPGPQLSGAYRNVLLAGKEPPVKQPRRGWDAAPERPPWRGPGPGLGPLIHRERDLSAVCRVLEKERLVTVTGPPGCGKSVLALQAAARVRDRYSGGVTVLECSRLTDHEQLFAGLVRLLDGTPGLDAPSDLLGARQLLVVLDNVEHLIDSCASVVDDVVRSCQYASVVVTSREPLGLPYETIWRLATLTVPHNDTEVWAGDRPAVQLFARRAAQVCPDFRLGADNVDTVARLCENLDDLPLAVELAACCLATDTLEEVVRRLADPLHEFKPPRRGAPAHQRSLWAALRRSLDCLNEGERWCFVRLGSLPRCFRPARAQQAWASAPGRRPVDVPAMLTRLVDMSLLIVRHEPGGRSYYVPRLVHRFAIELSTGEFA
jgi:predicted ATPase/DNA-binding SARP family transcriptional activator